MKLPAFISDVLCLALVGGFLLAFLAFVVPAEHFDVLLPIVGALGGLMFARLAPKPDPAVPESIAALLRAHAFGTTVPQVAAEAAGTPP